MKLIPHKENLCSKDATKMLSIKINNTCNCSCSFCVDKGGYKTNNINIEKISDEAILYIDYKTVIITGGEPFLNFYDVIELIKKNKTV
jgi:molybdenum cofactor biosynthesis enzyme MoaA